MLCITTKHWDRSRFIAFDSCSIPCVPVRQWVLSFPMPLRSLFAVYPELLTAVLRILHRAIHTHLIQQTGVKRIDAASGAITLIQRFGSAANLKMQP